MSQLKTYLSLHSDMLVSEIIDSNGKTLLHECTFNDSFNCLQLILELGKSQPPESSTSTQKLLDWINIKDHGDGFAALHFASFKGNPDACELLI